MGNTVSLTHMAHVIPLMAAPLVTQWSCLTANWLGTLTDELSLIWDYLQTQPLIWVLCGYLFDKQKTM